MSRRSIVAGNWKMNLDRAESVSLASRVASLAERLDNVELAIFPGVLWTVPVADEVADRPVVVGVQDSYIKESGAYTGEISPASAATICTAALVGHSERRHVIGEPDDLVRAKLDAVLRAGLTCYLCVGETLDERESGNAEGTTTRQLASALDDLDPALLEKLVVAYEPVWAIGTGVAATPEDAQEMCSVVRGWLVGRFGDPANTVPVLYGGSVNGANAQDLFGQPDVDGGLIGGASLDPDEFGKIAEVAARLAV